MFFKSSQEAAFLIVGLGNPGKQYENTRHNVGFDAVDYMAGKAGVKINKAKFSALYGTGEIGGKKAVFIKPQTFMNLSGNAVGRAAKFYKISPENVLIIYDDVSLSVGRMRIRTKGSAGGHNGIKSIIAAIGDTFPRIKIGVGEKPSADYDLADWVLGKFTSRDRKRLEEKFCDVHSAARLIARGEAEKAMNLYNR